MGKDKADYDPWEMAAKLIALDEIERQKEPSKFFVVAELDEDTMKSLSQKAHAELDSNREVLEVFAIQKIELRMMELLPFYGYLYQHFEKDPLDISEDELNQTIETASALESIESEAMLLVAACRRYLGKRYLTFEKTLEITKTYPDNYYGWYMMAAIWLGKDEMKKAKEAMDKAITLGPENKLLNDYAISISRRAGIF